MLIAITRSDGGLSIMSLPLGADIQLEVRKWERLGLTAVSWREVQPADVPTDRANREAWIWDGARISVDPVRALALYEIRAAASVDGMDRLQFAHLFELENRARVLESKPQITPAQYRDALIARWKTLNP